MASAARSSLETRLVQAHNSEHAVRTLATAVRALTTNQTIYVLKHVLTYPSIIQAPHLFTVLLATAIPELAAAAPLRQLHPQAPQSALHTTASSIRTTMASRTQ